MTVRIIPRLDIKGPNLVKGIHLEGLRVLGKPERFARHYYENGADELLYMDVVASLYGRNSLVDIIRRTSSEIMIPLTVGGGLRSIEDIREVLRSGADKVALNSAAIRRPELITEASEAFGSSTILVSVEALRMPDGSYQAFVDNGREATGIDALEWAVHAAELGAGEIMVTAIHQEGTGKGFDLELVRSVSRGVSVPVIACGGAGSAVHVREAIADGEADAVAVASLLHYEYAARAVAEEAEFVDEGNIRFLKSGRAFSRVEPTPLFDVKRELIAAGIECRMTKEEYGA